MIKLRVYIYIYIKCSCNIPKEKHTYVKEKQVNHDRFLNLRNV